MSRRRHRLEPDGPVRPDELQLQPFFDEATWKRGEDYQRRGRVFDLEMEDDEIGTTLTAEVQGSAGARYRVNVALIAVGGEVNLVSECECPVGRFCKHAVATLLQALRRGWFDEDGAPPPSAQSSAPRPTPPKPVRSADPLAGPLGRWLDELAAAAGAEAPSPPGRARGKSAVEAKKDEILYILDAMEHPFRRNGVSAKLDLLVTRRLKDERWGAGRSYTLESMANNPNTAVTSTDRAVAKLLTTTPPGHYGVSDGYDWLNGEPAAVEWAMERILASGRAYWRDRNGVALFRGPDQPGRIGWRLTVTGDQAPTLRADADGLTVLPGTFPWVVDPESGACGKLLTGLSAETLKVVLSAPPAPPEAAAALAQALAQRLPGLNIDPPRADVTLTMDDSPPAIVLRLVSKKLPPAYGWGGGKRTVGLEEWVDGAWLSFDYGGVELASGAPPADMRRVEDGKVWVRKRRSDIEAAAMRRLTEAGLAPLGTYADHRAKAALSGGGLTFVPPPPSLIRVGSMAGGGFIDDTPRWPDFIHRIAPQLRADGWRIVMDESFRHQVAAADGEWRAEVEDKGGWWFSLELGVEVEGRQVPLLPILLSVLNRLTPGAPLESLAAAGVVYGRLPDGRPVALPFERVRRLMEVLVEAFGERAAGAGDRIDLSLAQAVGLEAIAEAVKLRWVGGERLRALARRLGGEGIGDGPPPPAGFRADLRPYQRRGFAWLQFLADEGLGGVLADDMGLGKTVQTLAHILAEKEAGRLDKPFLVVAPTSLIPTWREEAARFAPDLRVLVMHGLDRPRDLAALAGVDLVLTTYPLLARDGDLLTKVEWRGAALDEAQAIKNPTAKWTLAACKLKADHRLCLTGTPVENHLGEAWSQFAFLMPGLLGDSRAFAKFFRTPIEKKGDGERRSLLARRLKPFLLRRTKGEVAAELPPKTEVIRHVELAGAQRDLYETLRLAMDGKVRQAVAAKGLARSAIVILDALLKLRQACCDPRLVKLRGAAKTAIESAKLEHLMEFLPELVEEGRRVLLFSQFTGMLDLIKLELAKAGIPYVELTGDTKDRETPVKTFQSGAVPLFLISLKAGGVGLTLTAADTVIHYDPWWNPAVEDQATDRAHRIGQDKPVFVYKLIAAGTVEERMVELQSRKRAVAAALFNEDGGDAPVFSEADLAALFQPLG